MSVQMISGPDLGGGFLHQLSFESTEDSATFTFHAQDGGSDASGPPLGPLDPLGYVHPSTPCMFGGPRCWHRRFRLPLTDAPRVRMAYNRGRFVLETTMGQLYREAPVAVDPGLQELVGRIAPALEREGIDWYVGGSVAARLQGVPLSPHDIDLGTTRAGVDRIASALTEYLVEPVGPTDWPGRGIVHGARAFVGTFQQGVRVEWAVPLDPSSSDPVDEWSGRPGRVRTQTVQFHGRTVRVTRPEYALVRAVERGREDVVRSVSDWLREHGTDRELLSALLAHRKVPAERARALLAGLGT